MTDLFDKVPPHGLIHDWLGQETVERLMRFAQSQEHRFEDAGVTHRETEAIDLTKRVSKKLGLGSLKNEVRVKMADSLPVMFDVLRIKPFLPSRLEVELVVHGDGAFFVRHTDNTQQSRHRIISAVYYFHVLPKAFTGGVLRLHSLAGSGRPGTFVDISPDYDTLVFFPSFVPHEVSSVRCPTGEFIHSRFAINCWIHRS